MSDLAMKITLAPWFGGKRNMAMTIVEELGAMHHGPIRLRVLIHLFIRTYNNCQKSALITFSHKALRHKDLRQFGKIW